jgi:hypothetical protein
VNASTTDDKLPLISSQEISLKNNGKIRRKTTIHSAARLHIKYCSSIARNSKCKGIEARPSNPQLTYWLK